MSYPNETTPFPTDRELVLERHIAAPPEKLFRAWTDAALIPQWFVPKPWGVVSDTLDVRPGGANVIVMHDPAGNEFPSRGVYLEVVKNERLVFTDAFITAWQPSEKPFVTMIITFTLAADGGTDYMARVRHWTVTDREAHEKMGFYEGWGKATDQLEALVVTAPSQPVR